MTTACWSEKCWTDMESKKCECKNSIRGRFNFNVKHFNLFSVFKMLLVYFTQHSATLSLILKDILDKLLLYLDDRVKLILNTCAMQLWNDEFYIFFRSLIHSCFYTFWVFISIHNICCWWWLGLFVENWNARRAMIVVGIFSLNKFNWKSKSYTVTSYNFNSFYLFFTHKKNKGSSEQRRTLDIFIGNKNITIHWLLLDIE
jgi:hypothetical protein